MADVGWLHRGIPASFNTRAGAELSCLSKTYGPSAEVSRRNQDFSTTVEVKGGDNGKVGGSCKFGLLFGLLGLYMIHVDIFLV